MAGSVLSGWFLAGSHGTEGIGDGMPPWWSPRAVWYGEGGCDTRSCVDPWDCGRGGGRGMLFSIIK